MALQLDDSNNMNFVPDAVATYSVPGSDNGQAVIRENSFGETIRGFRSQNRADECYGKIKTITATTKIGNISYPIKSYSNLVEDCEILC
jgi:hypothetical protein